MKKFRLTEYGQKSLDNDKGEGNAKGVFILSKHGLRYDLGNLTDDQAVKLLGKDGTSQYVELVPIKK